MDKTDLILQLASSEEVQQKCPRQFRSDDPKSGSESGCAGCKYLIKSEEHLNCAVIAWSFGPFSQTETAEMLDLSQTSVSEAETSGKNKIQRKVYKHDTHKDLRFHLDVRHHRFVRQQESMQADIDILEALMEKYGKKPAGRR